MPVENQWEFSDFSFEFTHTHTLWYINEKPLHYIMPYYTNEATIYTHRVGKTLYKYVVITHALFLLSSSAHKSYTLGTWAYMAIYM